MEKKNKLGIFLALILAAALLTSVGVFIDITIITLAPIALEVAKRSNFSRSAVLVALVGGGKAGNGNMISPNPNTIAASEAFNVDLISLMAANIVPALATIAATIFVAVFINKTKASLITEDLGDPLNEKELPPLWQALAAPIAAILLLALRPIAKINIDPLVALPVGGLLGCLIMGKIRGLREQIEFGLSRMGGVALLLLGTGAIAGIIKGSDLTTVFIAALQGMGISANLLAPISGILMSFATASTTAGTAVASNTFGPIIIAAGITPISAAAMIHTGATVLDHVPHGSFFHAAAGSVNMDFKERLSLIPYESFIGLVMTTVSWLIYAWK